VPVSHLLEEWVPRVYRFALRLSGDPHAADDLTQDTFLRAWRSQGQVRDAQALRVWLFRIAVNLWRDRRRRGRSPVARAEPLPDGVIGRETQAERVAVGREELDRALGLLNGLPPRQREVLHLSACETLTAAEIAGVLSISRESVKANLSLARKAMRELLKDTNDERLRTT
jgi:RNA polymerase sigma-70 factor (ECF subfamily)